MVSICSGAQGPGPNPLLQVEFLGVQALTGDTHTECHAEIFNKKHGLRFWTESTVGKVLPG